MIVRWIFWILLALMLIANGAFDLLAAPVALRMATKVERQMRGEGTAFVAAEDEPGALLLEKDSVRTMAPIARFVLDARFFLTLLPAVIAGLVVAYRRVDDVFLATMIALGAFILVGKVYFWNFFYALADMTTMF